MNPLDWYQQKEKKYREAAGKFQQRYQRLTAVRIVLFLGAFAAIFLGFGYTLVAGGVVLLAAIVALGWFVTYHEKINTRQQQFLLLAGICKEEQLVITNHHRTGSPGSRHVPADHPYAMDLDVFGEGSLFALLNTTRMAESERRLAQWLLYPANLDTIRRRQHQIGALRHYPAWMIQFRAYANALPQQEADSNALQTWANKPLLPLPRWITLLAYLTPAIFICTIIAYLGDWTGGWAPLLAATVHGVLIYQTKGAVQTAHRQVDHVAPSLRVYGRLLQWLEQAPFQETPLRDLQYPVQSPAAGRSIRMLTRLLQHLDLRHNILGHLPLNWLFLWDIHVYRRLTAWHRTTAKHLPQWLETLFETEALIALATLHHHRPRWPFAHIDPEAQQYTIEGAGHPLIHPGKRVDNDFQLHRGEQWLITGSNMAGKSTFLRAIGLNMVLAQAGAPVCATKATLPLTHLITSMRTFDSVRQNASSFYAELRQLQRVLQQVATKKNTFFLIDEVLKGTNSADRHKGAVALVHQLIHANGTGMITTHDIELATHFSNHTTVHNKSFEVEIHDDVLVFDYKIKTGICHSFNATVLMKKMGIHVE